MSAHKESNLARREPFGVLGQLASELDHMFEDPFWGPFRLPRAFGPRPTSWLPEIDVFEKDGRLVTRVDLPGIKREDVKVAVGDGQLVISGERKSEVDERKENYYRCEREYGSFSRAVPLPKDVTLDDVKATFADGVLEVSVPLPRKEAPKVRQVEIQEPAAAARTAARSAA